jgi:tRNA/rRNA methyltransferase
MRLENRARKSRQGERRSAPGARKQRPPSAPLPVRIPLASRICVILLAPKYEGNVGAVARVMKNFGARELRLIRPCHLGNEARRRAMHASDILDEARQYPTLEAATRDLGLVVGTSGVSTSNEKNSLRISMTPRELTAKLVEFGGRVGLVFGPEDFGLNRSELRQCDVLASIPAEPAYPILNVAQAVAILLYELHTATVPARKAREASVPEKERMYEAFSDLLAAIAYPSHKRVRTAVMFRRLLGRATPTKWEFHALVGVLALAARRIRRTERQG